MQLVEKRTHRENETHLKMSTVEFRKTVLPDKSIEITRIGQTKDITYEHFKQITNHMRSELNGNPIDITFTRYFKNDDRKPKFAWKKDTTRLQ